jgi:hypothetical protein
MKFDGKIMSKLVRYKLTEKCVKNDQKSGG